MVVQSIWQIACHRAKSPPHLAMRTQMNHSRYQCKYFKLTVSCDRIPLQLSQPNRPLIEVPRAIPVHRMTLILGRVCCGSREDLRRSTMLLMMQSRRMSSLDLQVPALHAVVRHVDRPEPHACNFLFQPHSSPAIAFGDQIISLGSVQTQRTPKES